MFNFIGTALAHMGENGTDYSNMMGGNMMNMMSYGWGIGGGWGWTMMIFGGLFWLLVIVALILLIAWLIKQINK